MGDKIKQWWIFLMISILGSGYTLQSWAATEYPTLGKRSISKTEGLSSDEVTAMAFDSEGRLWLGTDGRGINVVTNGEVKVFQYRPGASTSLASNVINDIVAVPSGEVVISTNMGISQFSPFTGDFVNYFPDALMVDGEAVKAKNSYDLEYDAHTGLVWGASYSVLFSFDPVGGEVCEYPLAWETTSDQLKHMPVNLYAVAVDRDYVYTGGLGVLWRMSKSSNRFEQVANVGEPSAILSVSLRGAGLIHIQTKRNEYLYSITDKKLLFSKGNGLDEVAKYWSYLDDQVTSASDSHILAERTERGVEIQTGLSRQIRHIRTASSAACKRSVGEQGAWLAGPASLFRFGFEKAIEVDSFPLPFHLRGKVTCLEDLGRFVAIGTQVGVYQFDKKLERLAKVAFPPFLTERRDAHWVSDMEQLGDQLLVGGTWPFWLEIAENGLQPKPVERPIFAAPHVYPRIDKAGQGNTFVFSPYGSPLLVEWDSVLAGIRSVSSLNAFFYMDVQDVAWDNSRNCFWAVGKSWGLYGFRKKAGTTELELFHHVKWLGGTDQLSSVMPDSAGRLWLGSDEGLICYQPEDRVWHQLTAWEGLPSNAHFDGGLRMLPGNILLGQTKEGGYYFQVDSIVPFLHPVRGEELSLSNCRTLSTSGRVVKQLNYPNTFPLSLALSGKEVGLQMKLGAKLGALREGLQHLYFRKGEEEWKQLDEGLVVTIPSLKPGRHSLQIGSLAGNGEIETIKDIALYKKPDWYQHPALYIVLIGVFGGLLAQLVRYRERALSAANRKLQDTVRERTRQIEEERNQVLAYSKELEMLNKQKDQLFINVIHELKTPLAVLNGPFNYLERVNYLPDRDKVKSFSLLASQSLQDIQSLMEGLNQLVNLSKKDRPKPELTPVWLYLFLVQRFNMGKALAHFHGVNLEYRVDVPRGTSYLTAPSYLSVILNNLINNAVKYTPRSRKVVVDAALQNQVCKVVVWDEGPGIPESFLEKVFDRFFQVPGDGKSGGLGVGLAIVKDYLQQLGGSVTVSSQPGKGAVFTVQVPVEEAGAEAQALPVVEQPALALGPVAALEHTDNKPKPAIAIIEDNPQMHSLFGALLRGTYHIHAFSGGEHFIEWAKDITPDQWPDLIITDIMMSDGNGLELIKWLKSEEAAALVPVIVVSALDFYQTRTEVHALGVYDFLPKPFFQEELLVKVKRLLMINHTRVSARQELQKEGAKFSAPEELHSIKEKVEAIARESIARQNISVGEIAKRIFISRRHLNRLLQAESGMSVNEVIREVKLQEAYQLIKSEKMTIREVSLKVGYSSPSYFSRLFEARFGIKPYQLQQNYSV